MERPLTRQDLETVITGLEARLSTKIEAAEARMGQRIEAAEPHMEGKLDAVEQRLYDHIRATAENTETRLLTAFHRYTEEQHKRMIRVETAEAADSDRIAKLEERVRALEERLDFPHYPGRVS